MLSLRTHPQRSGGFTLIELAVAMSLLGILLALGLPSLSGWVKNAQVRTVADAIQTGVRLAQTEALRLNQQVVLSLTNAQPALNAAAVANGKNWSIQTVNQFGKTAEFVRGGALADVASGVSISGPAAICLNSNGRLVTNAAPGVPGSACNAANAEFNVSQTNADRSLRVTVSLAGQVRMCDPLRPTLSSTSPDGCP